MKLKIKLKTKFLSVNNDHLIQLVNKIMTYTNTGDDDDIDKNEKYSKTSKNGRYYQSTEVSFMNYI